MPGNQLIVLNDVLDGREHITAAAASEQQPMQSVIVADVT